MDEDKKQELAEFDKRWDFEKTVNVPTENKVDWKDVKSLFNDLQDTHGDLYMTVLNLPLPGRWDNLKLWNRDRVEQGEEVTFHHRQVYNFYRRLAHELGESVGFTVYKLMCEKHDLRDHFGLGETVNVQMNNVDLMDTSEKTSVSRDELQELISDE